jgi:hypothetical protein
MWYANRSGTSLKRKAFYRETENQKEGWLVVVQDGIRKWDMEWDGECGTGRSEVVDVDWLCMYGVDGERSRPTGTRSGGGPTITTGCSVRCTLSSPNGVVRKRVGGERYENRIQDRE